MKSSSLLLILFIASGSAVSQSGNLDISWANSGFNSIPFVSDQIYIHDIGLQSDGKSILVGGRKTGANFDMYVLRLNVDGSVDETFGDNNGDFVIDFGFGSDVAHSVVIDDQDRIVLGGYAVLSNGTNRFAIVRLTPNGTLDTDFSVDGKYTSSIGNINDIGHDLVIQPDGKFLLAGTSYSNNSDGFNFAILRLNSDGVLPDSGFGNNGLISLDTGADDEGCFALALQSDGKILMTGESNPDNFQQFTTIRLETDGDPDYSFGNNSTVLTSFGTSALAKDILITEDNKIVVAGQGRDNSALESVCMASYLSDGSPDLDFGEAGVVITQTGSNFNEYSLATCIRQDATGKYLVCGSEFKNEILSPLLLRYYPNGILDESFGAAGKALLNGSDYGEYCVAQSCISTPDDGIIITGYGGNIGAFQQRSFKFIGCTSNIIATNATACGSYTWDADGNTYSSSGTYVYSIDTGLACDTIYELHLLINNLPILQVIQNNSTLTASQGNATYQWLDCFDGMIAIPGATNQSYTPQVSGSYAVVINSNGCIDTTSCYQVTINSVAENLFLEYKLFPNPTNDNISIRSSEYLTNIELFDLAGHIVLSWQNLHAKYISLPVHQLAGGTYFVKFQTASGKVQIEYLTKF